MNPRLPAARRIAVLLSTSLLLAGAVCAHEGKTHASPASAPLGGSALAVAEVLGQYATALTANDLEAVRPLIADERAFSYFEGSHVDRSWQDYHDHAVLSQTAGQWRIRHLHTSMVPARKPGASAH